jgi:hypothetical protein
MEFFVVSILVIILSKFARMDMCGGRPVSVPTAHEIPLKAQKSTGENELFPFLLQEELADLFVNIEAHLLLPDDAHVPLEYLLVCNMSTDTLRKLLELGEKSGSIEYFDIMQKRCFRALWACSYDALPSDIASPRCFPLRAFRIVTKVLKWINVRFDKISGQLSSPGLMSRQHCFAYFFYCEIEMVVNASKPRTNDGSNNRSRSSAESY